MRFIYATESGEKSSEFPRRGFSTVGEPVGVVMVRVVQIGHRGRDQTRRWRCSKGRNTTSSFLRLIRIGVTKPGSLRNRGTRNGGEGRGGTSPSKEFSDYGAINLWIFRLPPCGTFIESINQKPLRNRPFLSWLGYQFTRRVSFRIFIFKEILLDFLQILYSCLILRYVMRYQ